MLSEFLLSIFINKYKWEGINFSSEKDDKKEFEKNNVAIALNVLYVKKEKVYPAYVSKKLIKSWKSSYSFNDSKRRGTQS